MGPKYLSRARSPFSGTALADFLWLSLLIFIYFLLWAPTIPFQPPLSTGDNGRDLYAYWRVLEGEWPARDFWYQYSPLMPLYYAFWFLLGGVHLVSLRIGLGVLLGICGVLTFRTLRIFVSPPAAFLASVAFLRLDLIHTFNHVGAFPFLLIAILSLWKFFLTGKIQWVYFGVSGIAGIALVKLSVGGTSFAAFFSSLWLYHLFSRQENPALPAPLAPRHFGFLSLIFIVPVLGIYTIQYAGLSLDWIRQCMAITAQLYSVREKLIHIPMRFLFWERRRLWWLGAFLTFGGLAWIALKKKRSPAPEKRVFLSVTGSLILFGLANSADYFLMEGYIHRLDFWFFPIFLLAMGLFAQWAHPLFSRPVKIFLAGLVFLVTIWIPFRNVREALAWRVPERYLDFPHGRVYFGGEPSYVATLKKGTQFIIENTKPGEEILTLPYDPLYCFLAGRKHATRELLFTSLARIPEKQEDEIIQELERKQTPLILISNRSHSKEWMVGHLGETHLKRLSRYVFEHYQEAKTFGPWEKDFAQVHAVKFLKRKTGPAV